MTISINESVCKKNKLSLAELLSILLIKTGADIPKLFKSLEEKEVIVKDVFGDYMITQRWDDIASTILLDSDKDSQPPERLENLAIQLAEIFPKEKKAGTCHYFRGNKKDTILRLKKFFKRYGNKFTDEQILEAAKNYVASFNGNYHYMRVLKYFIWKDAKKEDADGNLYVDETSDLATLIENAGAIDSIKKDWTTSLN